MIVASTKPLFPWDALEDSPSLANVKKLLACIPDGRLLHMLRQHRGRNDYPMHILWGVLLVRIVLRHVRFEATQGTRKWCRTSRARCIATIARASRWCATGCRTAVERVND